MAAGGPGASRFVALDLEGFRSGSLNRALREATASERGAMSGVRVKVKLTFPESEVRRAVLATLVRRFDVDPDIRRADVEEHRGWIVCEMDGERPRWRRHWTGCAAKASPSTSWGTSSRDERPVGSALSGSRGTCHPAEDTLRGS